jgi:hypothetical protein
MVALFAGVRVRRVIVESPKAVAPSRSWLPLSNQSNMLSYLGDSSTVGASAVKLNVARLSSLSGSRQKVVSASSCATIAGSVRLSSGYSFVASQLFSLSSASSASGRPSSVRAALFPDHRVSMSSPRWRIGPYWEERSSSGPSAWL